MLKTISHRTHWGSIFLGLFFVASWIFYYLHPWSSPASSVKDPAQFLQTVSQLPASNANQLTLVTEPADGTQSLLDQISSAKKSADLVMYEFQDTQIEQALVDAKQRGVAVRVLMQNVDSYGKYPDQPAYDFFVKNNVPVKWAPSYFALTHQKTLITDNTTAYIMTFNLQPQYYATSRDFGVIDTNPTDVAAVATTFNNDWQGYGTAATSGNDLVWSPGSANVLLQLINSATTSLDVYNEEMADNRITIALENAAKRGVAVRVDMTYATNWKAAFNELTQNGVTVRTYSSSSNAFYIHAKVIVADKKLAFIGSENFSEPSLDSNRELGIITAQPNIISSLETTFNKDWLGSRPYTVK
jgi:phosphatidylserine/phosphatidylglycerophosphate/cardiolipin synthase-like enzyme